MKVTCDSCGREYHKQPSKVRPTNYCSRACMKGARNRVTIECSTCGKSITRPPSQILNNAFCSQECAKVFTSKGMHLYNSVREKKEARDRDHPLYKTWQGMKNRCFSVSNRDYGNYGGRGIMVCDRWKSSFHAFVQDMGPKPTKKHTIERLNNDGNYEPSNCCWATKAEQNRNKRNVKSIRNA